MVAVSSVIPLVVSAPSGGGFLHRMELAAASVEFRPGHNAFTISTKMYRLLQVAFKHDESPPHFYQDVT